MKYTIAECNAHLGDNPNHYTNSNYIGYTLEIPVIIENIDESSNVVNIIISTNVVETLAGNGHYVYINDTIVGRIKDEDGDEIEIIPIQRNHFKQLLGAGNLMLLKIRIDTLKDSNLPNGLLDDFIIKKIEIEYAKPKTVITIP